MLPKKIPNIRLSDSVDASQVRDLNTDRSIAGAASVSSQMMKNVSETAETIAHPTINCESNQSSSRPLSIMIWNAVTKHTSSPSPTPSMRERCTGLSCAVITRRAPSQTKMPKPMLM